MGTGNDDPDGGKTARSTGWHHDPQKQRGSCIPVLDPKEYAMLGGGFPICVEEVGVVATVAVSGMGQVSDHDVIVKCISKYLHIDEVPRIRTV